MSDTTGNISVPGFNPNTLRPGFYAAFDASNANTSAGQLQQTLIIGQVTSASTLTIGQPTLVAADTAAIAATGSAGSMLGREIARYFQDDPDGTVYVLPLADAGGATKAVSVGTLTGTATAAGDIYLEIGGQLVTTGVNLGDSATTIATNVVAAVNAQSGVPAVATSTAGTLTFTAINAGIDAGDLDVRVNYLGTAGGQTLPAGVALTAFALTAGTVNPVDGLTAALANLGTMNFDFIVCPYTDAPTLNLISAFLGQTSGRWSITQQLYGTAFMAYRGTVSSRTTFAATRNDQFIEGIGFYDSPTPSYEWAASFAAVCAASVRVNPATPLGDLPMSVLPPPLASQDTPPEQETLLEDGLSTFTVNFGVVTLQRARTFYTKNASGYPDNSWRDVNTAYTLMACIRRTVGSLATQFNRKILVANNTNISGGSAMTTAAIILGAANAIYVTLCNQAWAQDAQTFQKNSRAQNQGNGIVALFLPFNIANQLWIVAIDAQFLKT